MLCTNSVHLQTTTLPALEGIFALIYEVAPAMEPRYYNQRPSLLLLLPPANQHRTFTDSSVNNNDRAAYHWLVWTIRDIPLDGQRSQLLQLIPPCFNCDASSVCKLLRHCTNPLCLHTTILVV